MMIEANHDMRIIQNQIPMIKTIEGVSRVPITKMNRWVFTKEAITGGSFMDKQSSHTYLCT